MKRFKAIVAILIVYLAFTVIVEMNSRLHVKDRGSGPFRNRVRVMNVKAALDQFHATFERWPTNLSELKTNRQEEVFFAGRFEDFYGRPFIYEPPAKGVEGRIGSFGADGKAGGSKENEDCFVPLEAVP